MTPTSDERREVAARLREAKRDCERRGYPWMCDDLCLAIGYEHDYEADNGIFDRLADLIDPTCHVIPGKEAVAELKDGTRLTGVLLSCGHAVFGVSAKDMPRFCCECGARVVSSDGSRD